MATSGLVFEQFYKDRIQLLINESMDAAALGRAAAEAARANIEPRIAAGEFPPRYRLYVNGVENADPATVKVPGGTIVYAFSDLAEAAAAAYAYAVKRSPEESGDYKRAWFISVDGTPWTGDFADIPPGTEVVLTNRMPYHRKIDVGAMVMQVPPGIVEDTRQFIQKRFPALNVERRFVLIGGADQYILKGRAIASGLTYDKRQRKSIRLRPPQRTNRADARAGEPLTYPAVVLSERH